MIRRGTKSSNPASSSGESTANPPAWCCRIGFELAVRRRRVRRSGEEISRAIRHLLLFIGADPNTTWLSGSGVMLDDKSFVRTGANILRPPETSLPGVFAIGDVRSGSTKRVAAAVGDGAQVVAALHAFLAEASDKDALTINIGRQ